MQFIVEKVEYLNRANIPSYPENIKKIAQELLEIIEKYYAGLTNKNYDSNGYPNPEGSTALERAEMCIYIELMKAGAFDGMD